MCSLFSCASVSFCTYAPVCYFALHKPSVPLHSVLARWLLRISPYRLRFTPPACLPSCLPARPHPPVCLPVCLSACLSACLPVCLPVCLSVCLPVCLPACLPVCLSARPSGFLTYARPSTPHCKMNICFLKSTVSNLCIWVRRKSDRKMTSLSKDFMTSDINSRSGDVLAKIQGLLYKNLPLPKHRASRERD